MMSGKAVSRAIRGHLLVNAALNTLVAAKAFHIKLEDLDIGVSGNNEDDGLFEENEDANVDDFRIWILMMELLVIMTFLLICNFYFKASSQVLYPPAIWKTTNQFRVSRKRSCIIK